MSNDRLQMLAWQEEQETQLQVVKHLEEQEILGAAMARFCCAFYDALTHPMDDAERFSREEVLRLLVVALKGR